MKRKKVESNKEEIVFTPEKEKTPEYAVCRWDDSQSYLSSAWYESDDLNLTSLLINTAGIIIKENDTHITLAIGQFEREDGTIAVMCPATIPKSAIIKIKRRKFKV